MYRKASENWIKDFGESLDITNVITHLEGLTWQQAKETLQKVYGEEAFKVVGHGTVIVVYSAKAQEHYYQKRRDEGKGVFMNGSWKEPGTF